MKPAMDAFLLLATHVICVSFTGVIIFFAQGIRAATGWQADRAPARGEVER